MTRNRPGWVLALTTTAYFMVVLDALVVMTALPAMQHDLHADLDALQWTVNSYGIAFAAGIIIAAALGDRFGRRRIFNFGLILFTISSAACALAPTVGELITARTVQGLGAAVVMPLSLTLLMEAFPAERRGLILGVSGGLAGLAVAAGPLVGGAVTQGLDWHWIFWLNVPIGAVAVALTAVLIGESRGVPERLDLTGIALVTGGVTALVWALTRGNDVGWTSAQTVLAVVAGAALLAAFVAWERRCADPAVPLRLFADRDFSAGNVASFLMGATPCAAFLVTQEFQFARGLSPLSTGLRLLPFFATPMLVSPLAGALSDRVGRRTIMLLGFALQVVGYGWVALRGSLGTGWGELVVALFVAGVGISMDLPTVPTAVLNAVPADVIGKASGVNNMAQRFGAVFAIAVGTAVFSAAGHLGTPAAVTAGFRPAMWSAAALAALGALAVLRMPPRAADPARVPVAADTLVAA